MRRVAQLRRLQAAATVALAAGIAAALVAALSPGGSSPVSVPPGAAPAKAGSAEPAGGARSVPDPVDPAFTPGEPRLLARETWLSRWARVRFATEAHAEPRADSSVIATLETRTPEGTDNIVLVLGTAEDDDGALWVRVRLAVLPNNTTAWVARSSLGGYGLVSTRLVIDLGDLRATLFRRDEPVFEAPIGIGRPESPTPTGDFYVRNRLSHFDDAFFGPIAFGTNARSPRYTDWPAGGFVGIHGTSRPELLPGRVSHGCIRLRNADILRLDRLMPVGTPVTIR